MNTKNAYADAGVDVNVEAHASRIMFEASRETYANRAGKIGEVELLFDDFAGSRAVPIGGLPLGSYCSLGFDGAGTKVEIAQRVKRHETIAFCLLAMLCDDVPVRGGEPALVGSVLDIKTLGSDERYLPIIRDLATGCVAAAKEAGVAVINGEIAQMGACVSGYGDFPFNWSGACLWFARKDRLLSGSEIKPGQKIVALRERGTRANGLSRFRKTFREAFGNEWHEVSFRDTTLGEAVLTPSKIYSRFLVHLNGGFAGDAKCHIAGVAHITGGGIPEKLGRILRKSGLGARLDSLWEPAPIMWKCQAVGNHDDRDAYGMWCMGNGMVLVTEEPDIVVREAPLFGVEAQVAGEIRSEPGIMVKSKGWKAPGTWLSF